METKNQKPIYSMNHNGRVLQIHDNTFGVMAVATFKTPKTLENALEKYLKKSMLHIHLSEVCLLHTVFHPTIKN